jgi:hypothetical protein
MFLGLLLLIYIYYTILLSKNQVKRSFLGIIFFFRNRELILTSEVSLFYTERHVEIYIKSIIYVFLGI